MPLSPARPTAGRRRIEISGRPVVLAAVGTGAGTLLGLLALSLVVIVVQSLDPTGGLPAGRSIAVACRLWLLAQGAGLAEPSGPLVLAPLLLTLLVGAGLGLVGRTAVRLEGDRDLGTAAAVLAAVVAVHVPVTLLVAVLTDRPDTGVDVGRAVLGAALLAVLAGGGGALSGSDTGLLDRLPGPARPVVRGGLAGLLAAVALCAVVVAVAVAADADGYARVSARLGGSVGGAAGTAGLALLFLPNAAAAVLGMAAGPGFAVGTATSISVHGITLGPLPALPLFAALPDTQAVPLIAWVSQAIPVLAGLVAGTTVGRRMTDSDGGSLSAALWGVLSGVLIGVGAVALTWAGGGSLGDGRLNEVGAPALATGIAVAAQAGIAAALAGAVARWRARG